MEGTVWECRQLHRNLRGARVVLEDRDHAGAGPLQASETIPRCGLGLQPTPQREKSLIDPDPRAQALKPADALSVGILLSGRELAQVTQEQWPRSHRCRQAFFYGRRVGFEVADQHGLHGNGQRPQVEQRARLAWPCRLGGQVIHVAEPVQIARREQSVVNHMLLPPKFKRQVQQYVGMLAVNGVGHILNAFVNPFQRFCPRLVLVSLGVATGSFAISVEHGGQINLHVFQMITANQVADAPGGDLPIRCGQAHDGALACRGAGKLGPAVGFARGPIGVLTINGRPGADRRQRHPEAEPQMLALGEPYNFVQAARERLQVDGVLTIFRLPSVIDGENVKPHAAGNRDQLAHDIPVDAAEKWLPGVVYPGRLVSAALLQQHFRSVGRHHPMGISRPGALVEKGHRTFGAGESFLRGEGALKRKQVRVVHHLQALAPINHLGTLEITRHLIHHDVAFPGVGTANRDGGIIHAARIEDLAGLLAIERRNLQVIGRGRRKVHGLENQVGQAKRGSRNIANLNPLPDDRMPRIHRVMHGDPKAAVAGAHEDAQILSRGCGFRDAVRFEFESPAGAPTRSRVGLAAGDKGKFPAPGLRAAGDFHEIGPRDFAPPTFGVEAVRCFKTNFPLDEVIANRPALAIAGGADVSRSVLRQGHRNRQDESEETARQAHGQTSESKNSSGCRQRVTVSAGDCLQGAQCSLHPRCFTVDGTRRPGEEQSHRQAEQRTRNTEGCPPPRTRIRIMVGAENQGAKNGGGAGYAPRTRQTLQPPQSQRQEPHEAVPGLPVREQTHEPAGKPRPGPQCGRELPRPDDVSHQPRLQNPHGRECNRHHARGPPSPREPRCMATARNQPPDSDQDRRIWHERLLGQSPEQTPKGEKPPPILEQRPDHEHEEAAFTRIDQSRQPEVRHLEVQQINRRSEQGHGQVSGLLTTNSHQQQCRGSDKQRIGHQQSEEHGIPCSHSASGGPVKRLGKKRDQHSEPHVFKISRRPVGNDFVISRCILEAGSPGVVAVQRGIAQAKADQKKENPENSPATQTDPSAGDLRRYLRLLSRLTHQRASPSPSS